MKIRIFSLHFCIFVWLIPNKFCLITAKLSKVYEENPFLNGEFQPGINLPQGPVNDPGENETGDSPPIIDPIQVNYRPIVTSRPTISPGQPIGPLLPPHVPIPLPGNDDLYKYCLHPRGQFQSRYCNAFVNCWDGNVVEQFCGPTLVFNPNGYCDYAWNVNCHGKPIKDIPISGASNGWPSDGSYVPPPPPTQPPGNLPTPPRPPVPPGIYRPSGGGIFTIEPPGFGNPQQEPISPPIYLPPYRPTQAPTRPTPPHTLPPVVTLPAPGSSDLRKYCLHPRGQFAGPHCTKFVNCWDDVVVEQDCPAGLHFNPHKHYCDFPYNYPCIIFKDSADTENYQNQFNTPQGNELAF